MSKDFISVIEEIVNRDDMTFCDDEEERTGKRPFLCVFQNEEFVGKIRFSNTKGGIFSPSVDQSVLYCLNKKSKT